MNHTPDLLESHKELCCYINNQGGRLDLKNHYSGSFCASNWINLSEDPGYGHSELINHITNNLGEIFDRCNFESEEKVDFVSLGCGDGKIDKKILYQLQS